MGPYRVLYGLLAVAVGMNLAFGNTLWLWYSVLGFLFTSLVLTLDWKGVWKIDSRMLYLAGIPFAMHYIGGSLSGLHQIGGPNGLYFVFPWWDDAVHFMGSFAAAASAYAVLADVPKKWRVLCAISIATTLGVFIELYEFSQFIFFDTVDQGYYTNTMLDFWNNFLGAILGALLGRKVIATA